MRSRYLGCLVFLVATLSFSQAQEKGENPFKSAKVGDYLLYKTTITGRTDSSTMKQTVVEVTPTEVTVEVETKVDGKEAPVQKIKIDLTKPLDAGAPNLKDGTTQTEKGATGVEPVTINGKEYSCTWTKYKNITKIKTSNGTKEFTAKSIIWTNKEIPLSGVARVETVNDFVTSTMELVEFGSKK